MSYSLIGAALVIGLLICFSVLAILWLSRVVTNSIKKRTVELFSTYDDILEEKARTFNEQISQEKNTEIPTKNEFSTINNNFKDNCFENKENEHENISMKLLSSSYRDENVGNIYKKIRYGFDAKPEIELSKIQFENDSQESVIADSILSSFSFESFYKLTSLSATEQLAVLKDVFSSEQISLLDDYYQHSKNFSIISFYNYLNDIKDRGQNKPVLHVSSSLDVSNVPKNTRVIVDPDILEGFTIETGNKIYDYSIKTREIS